MVTLPVISTEDLVRAYQFISRYEMVKAVGIGSIGAIAYALFRLPKPPRPPLGERLTPYLRAVSCWRWTIFLGVILIALTAAMLLADFAVPDNVVNPALPLTDSAAARCQLVRFFWLLVPVVLLHALFWWAINQPTLAKAS